MYNTLDDLKNKDPNKKDDKNTKSYAGGTSSGMEIENPNDLDKIV